MKQDSKEGRCGGDHERNFCDWVAVEGIDGQHGGAKATWGHILNILLDSIAHQGAPKHHICTLGYTSQSFLQPFGSFKDRE
jgi:hypothetical protein